MTDDELRVAALAAAATVFQMPVVTPRSDPGAAFSTVKVNYTLKPSDVLGCADEFLKWLLKDREPYNKDDPDWHAG